MKTLARVALTLVIGAAGCAAGYELWNYYMLSPWTRDARAQADGVSIAPDISGFCRRAPCQGQPARPQGRCLVRHGPRSLLAGAGDSRGECCGPQGGHGDAWSGGGAPDETDEPLDSDEARQDAILTANFVAASYQQAVADRSTAQLNLDRTSVSGFVTNLTLDVGQYASVGTKVMALIDSDSYRRVRLAQRIPVRIHIDKVADGILISSGMTCTVVVDAPFRRSAILAALRG